jgi:trans-2,3-dihydro-3-hydroxyanthranilate isomerase
MRYQFYIVDVFTSESFSGSQLAVFPNAAGITLNGMQKLAREFNFAEAAFVQPSDDTECFRKIKAFTPKTEVMFAGNSAIGTATALASKGHCGQGGHFSLRFEAGSTSLRVAVSCEGDALAATLFVPDRLDEQSTELSRVDMAALLSLNAREILSGFFSGVGSPFFFVHLSSPQAVDRAIIDSHAWNKILSQARPSNVFFFAGTLGDGEKLYARMCAPDLGIEEDAATASACAALVSYVARNAETNGNVRLSVVQGKKIGRRSEIFATAVKAGGVVKSIMITGSASLVAEGWIEVPPALLK